MNLRSLTCGDLMEVDGGFLHGEVKRVSEEKRDKLKSDYDIYEGKNDNNKAP